MIQCPRQRGAKDAGRNRFPDSRRRHGRRGRVVPLRLCTSSNTVRIVAFRLAATLMPTSCA